MKIGPVCLLMSAVLLIGVSRGWPEALFVETSPTLNAKASTAALSLGRLETRDHVVTIIPGDQPTYTVADKEGEVLATGLDEAQLQARYPNAYKTVRDAVAGKLDASLGPREAAKQRVRKNERQK
jgi:hypothetical protein